MRRDGGYLLITEADGTKHEAATFTCRHCGCIVEVKPRAKAEESGGWCRRCSAPICVKCAVNGVCVPFEKKLEAMESRGRLLAAITGGR